MKHYSLALTALMYNLTTLVQGSSSSQSLTGSNEVIIYSLDRNDGSDEVPLLKVLEDLPKYFESSAKGGSSASYQDQKSADFPASFAFPKSYSYDLTFGLVT